MTDRLRGPGPVLGLWSVTADPKLLEVSAALKGHAVATDLGAARKGMAHELKIARGS